MSRICMSCGGEGMHQLGSPDYWTRCYPCRGTGEVEEPSQPTRSQRYAEMELRYDGPMPESAKRYIETGEW